MVNPHADWRIEFAGQLASRIVPLDGVRAIIVAGSVARHRADEFSDIEIPIFWHTLPDDNLRHRIVESLHGQFLFAFDWSAQEDQLLVNGVQVDLWHVTVQRQEEVIQGVLDGNRTDLGGLNAMDTIRSCIPLHGHDLVEQWKGRAREYPRALANAIIREHLESFRVDRLALCGARNDPTGFFSELAVLQQEAFLVLLALNGEYFPTFKWLYQTLDCMAIKPERIASRFREAFTADRPAVVADMEKVLPEIVGLVERHFPEVDTTLARRRLAYRRRSIGTKAGQSVVASPGK